MTSTGIPSTRRRRSRLSRPVNSRRRRVRNPFRAIFSRGDFGSLLVIWGMMLVTARALALAEWTGGLGTLGTVSLFAVGFGFLLARSHYSELVALVMSSVYSLGIVLCVNAWSLVDHGLLWGRIDILLGWLGTWFDQALAGDQPTHDDVAFVIFLSVLFWFLGHNAAWHTFRVDRVWRVIIPTGLVLITNQVYYRGDNSLDIYLIAFVLLSLLLLIHSHIETRERQWFMERVNFPAYVRNRFIQAGSVLAVIIVLMAWILPTGKDDKSLERVEKLLSGDAFLELMDTWNKLFSSLEGEGIATADYYGGDKLQLSGAIQLGDAPVLSVKAPEGPRYYWRSTVYDNYDFDTWEWTHRRTVRAYTDNSGLQISIGAMASGARTNVDQHVTMLIRASNLVYAAPQPVRFGLPVEIELDCVDDFSNTCVNNHLPSDIAIVQPRETLRRGDTYTITSSVNVASASMLRQAGQSYPDWVLRLYLQGIPDVSPAVRELAMQIVTQAGAQTPYDKAKAIERWLRTNITYKESIPAPTHSVDPIEWFLLVQKEGYCNYYATAMVLMLRTQGVPARMAAGFAQGTWDPDRQTYLVRERDAHTWVEVYFPGYGWVEFEPTADEAPLERPDDQTPQTMQPTLTPLPSFTPVPTLTPTPASTEETGANATPTGQSQDTFTTLTPTPAPSSTPPPLSTTKINGDSGSSALRIILWTLGIIALVIGLLIALVIFLIWYVEYRGLRGLNAIQKAYARLAIYARWFGLTFEQSTTPGERHRALVKRVPEGSQPFNQITRSYEQDRYAPPLDRYRKAHNERAIRRAWQDARRTFLRRLLRRG